MERSDAGKLGRNPLRLGLENTGPALAPDLLFTGAIGARASGR
jgi:hypothetical protein